MKKIILILTLVFPFFANATAIMFEDQNSKWTITDNRAVIFADGKKYICTDPEIVNDQVDNDGFVYSADTYVCGDRFYFALKSYNKTNLFLLRIYDGKREKVVIEKLVNKNQFRSLSSS